MNLKHALDFINGSAVLVEMRVGRLLILINLLNLTGLKVSWAQTLSQAPSPELMKAYRPGFNNRLLIKKVVDYYVSLFGKPIVVNYGNFAASAGGLGATGNYDFSSQGVFIDEGGGLGSMSL